MANPTSTTIIQLSKAAFLDCVQYTNEDYHETIDDCYTKKNAYRLSYEGEAVYTKSDFDTNYGFAVSDHDAIVTIDGEITTLIAESDTEYNILIGYRDAAQAHYDTALVDHTAIVDYYVANY